jgi:RNA polymerase sigma-54 factor
VNSLLISLHPNNKTKVAMAGYSLRGGIGLRQTQKINPQVILASRLLATNSVNLSQTIDQLLQGNVFYEPINRENVDIDELRAREIGGEVYDGDYASDLGYKMQGDGQSGLTEEVPQDRNKALSTTAGFLDGVEEQMMTLGLSAPQREIAFYLATNLDEKGFLTNIPQVYQFIHDTLSSDLNEIAFVHERLKNEIKPAGLFQSNIQECIQAQINDIKNDRDRNIIAHVFNHHYPLVVKREFGAIAKILGFSSATLSKFNDEIVDIINKIKRYPVEFGNAPLKEASLAKSSPDFIVSIEKGQLNVRSSGAVREHVDRHLSNCQRSTGIHARSLEKLMASKSDRNKEAIQYYQQHLNELRSVKQTLLYTEKLKLRFVKTVLETQATFLKSKDLNDLVPTMQKDYVVEEGNLRLHSHQISSMVRSCTIQMEDGSLFELKELFNRGYRTQAGEVISEGEVKKLIQGYIQSETPTAPFSDLLVTKYLRSEEGINIKTDRVTMLRDEMDIPSPQVRGNMYRSQSFELVGHHQKVSYNLDGKVSSNEIEKALATERACVFIGGEKKEVAFSLRELDEKEKLSLWEVGPKGALLTSNGPVAELRDLQELRGLMSPAQAFATPTNKPSGTDVTLAPNTLTP